METTILIVEDERILAEDLKDTLSDFGYTVVGCISNGKAAIEFVTSTRVDLVLMDIKLKGEMDGIQTADILRRRFDIPTVYTTAYYDKDILQRATTTQPLGYLIKPYRASEIKATIEIALCRALIEKKHKDSREKLEQNSKQWSDQIDKLNTTLNVLLERRQNEKMDVIDEFARDINRRVLPHLDTIQMKWPKKEVLDILTSLRATLEEIAQPAITPDSKRINLTPLETRVADLIRQGRTSKEISSILGITMRAVTFHRGNIREKCKIKNKKTNLRLHLNKLKL